MTGSVGIPRLAASETWTGGEWEAPAPQEEGQGQQELWPGVGGGCKSETGYVVSQRRARVSVISQVE